MNTFKSQINHLEKRTRDPHQKEGINLGTKKGSEFLEPHIFIVLVKFFDGISRWKTQNLKKNYNSHIITRDF